ncbi:hypothetical protein SAMN05216191_112173 [Paenibacillus jilunlii]|uniref:Uncharacterized protein n=1 Tax=Paenibacillus jilunlii TaxID=682956 RepID=A0A1G9T2X9_9BACL|nr:hypothetical protein SAMN05216191_112173 [Paenibacillus jilunlii]
MASLPLCKFRHMITGKQLYMLLPEIQKPLQRLTFQTRRTAEQETYWDYEGTNVFFVHSSGPDLLKFVNVNISKSIIQGSRFCQPELMSAHTSPWAKKSAPAGTITGQGAQGKGYCNYIPFYGSNDFRPGVISFACNAA